jgi:flagellar export protein FliJ
MSSFRFPLQKVLDWRQTQLDLEEARLQQRAAALEAVDRSRAELEAASVQTEVEVRRWNPVAGRDLEALGGFRLHVRAREEALAAERAGCAAALAAQQAAMLEARRRCRLLERLKEKRLAEWKAATDREMEELASECFLAQWSAGRGRL